MSEQRFAIPDATPHPHDGARGFAIVLAAILAIFVDQTGSTIVGTGLPYLQAITAASPDSASWIVSAFNAAYYPMILFSPWMMAKFGLRRLLVSVLVGFAAVSLALVFVTNFALFVALRVVQGALQGCIFVPAVMLLFTSLPIRALKFAPPAFVFISLSGATLGTALSGYLADTYNGGSIFVPGAIATLLTALIIVLAAQNHDVPQPKLSVDSLGLALSVATFGVVQYLSNEGERRNWLDDPTICIALALLAAVLPAFVLYELYVARAPHVDFRMFSRHRNLTIGGLVNVFVGAAGYSVTTLIGYLESSVSATPTIAGLLVVARVATYAVGVPLAFYLLIIRQAMDTRLIIRIGAIGSAIVLLAFAQSMTTTADIDTFVRLSVAFGLFFGFMNQPLGALVIGSMPLSLLAAGISIYKLSSPIGSMIATGVMQTMYDHASIGAQTRLASEVVLHRPAVVTYLQNSHGSSKNLVSLVTAQAHVIASARCMSLLAVLLLAVIPIVQLANVKRAERRTGNV